MTYALTLAPTRLVFSSPPLTSGEIKTLIWVSKMAKPSEIKNQKKVLMNLLRKHSIALLESVAHLYYKQFMSLAHQSITLLRDR